jgi:hypothetical protein
MRKHRLDAETNAWKALRKAEESPLAELIAGLKAIVQSLEEELTHFNHQAHIHILDEAEFAGISRQIAAIKGELLQARARLAHSRS